MFLTGQQVVCVDDKFPLDVQKHYTALPKEGVTYTVRGLGVGINWAGEEGELCVYLAELVNPKSKKPPHPERGFKAERFRPLETTEETVEDILSLPDDDKELVKVTPTEKKELVEV